MIETDPWAPWVSLARDTSGDPGDNRCFWPATSSSVRGRIRTASGVEPVRRPG